MYVVVVVITHELNSFKRLHEKSTSTSVRINVSLELRNPGKQKMIVSSQERKRERNTERKKERENLEALFSFKCKSESVRRVLIHPRSRKCVPLKERERKSACVACV